AFEPTESRPAHGEGGGRVGVNQGDRAADDRDAGQSIGGTSGDGVDDVRAPFSDPGGGDGEDSARYDGEQASAIPRIADPDAPGLAWGGFARELDVSTAVDGVIG